MTDKQKTTIAQHRRNGLGYKKISHLTGINENTVKTFCRRNGLCGHAVYTIPSNIKDACKCCGKPIIQAPGKKPKRFCNDVCRAKYWNSHLDLVNRKAYYNYTCPACGKAFLVYGNARRKYCCHDCYIDDRFGGGSHE